MGASDDAGQSLIEFLLMLPFLIGFAMILTRINTAIQISIVNQQYARAQALFLTFNNANYPELNYQKSMVSEQMNHMLMGVSGNVAPGNGEAYVPQAATQFVARTKKIMGSNTPQEEPSLAQGRALVRIRNSVTLCSPTILDDVGKALLALDASNRATGISNLNEQMQFKMMCGKGKLNYYE